MLLVLAVSILIVIIFWKPAKVYKVNIFEGIRQNVLIEDFNSDLDKKYWTIVSEGEVYNGELQYYVPKNVNISDGLLEIEARKESFEGSEYTSGLISTKGKFEFQYGKIIFRVKHAKGKGLLSAIWLLPADGSLYPEVDIYESLGNATETWTGVHYLNSDLNNEKNFVTVPSKDDFSIYEFNWDEDEISVLVDNKLIYKTNAGVPDKKMYLIINLSVGGIWPGDPNNLDLPAKFLLDYVIIIPKGMSEEWE